MHDRGWIPSAGRLANGAVGAVLAIVLCGCSGTPPLPDLPEIDKPIDTKVLWKASVGNGKDFDLVPVVVGPALYAAAHDGTLVRFEVKSGNEVWRTDVKDRISAGVGATADLVVVGTLNGRVVAFDPNGKTVWDVRVTSEVLGPPLIAADLVVVRTADNRVFGLSATDGKRRWTYQRVAPALTVRANAGAAADQNLIFAGFPGGKLVALAMNNGALRWEGTVSSPKGTTELERVSDVVGVPWLMQREVCAVSFQGRAACFDADNGAPLWTRDISSASGLMGEGRIVYVADAKGAVAALDRSTGAIVWRQDKLTRRALSVPLPIGRFVAVGDGQGLVHLLDRVSGEFVARMETDGSPIVAAPRPIEAGFVVQTRRGTIYAFGVL
ncbi:MAG: outer membrane protein assembly factor BamB [Betaproteobacteria bacterium]|nr:outer membrane protein assembly factor BamB [Betaproteobacteria bacterium]